MDDGVEGSGKGRGVTLKKSTEHLEDSGPKGLHAMKKPLFKLAVPILALPRTAKRFVALSVDLGLCILTVWLAYYLRLGEFVALSGNTLWAAGAAIAIALPIFVVSGLYRAIFRYSGWPALLAVTRAVGIYGLLYASIFFLFDSLIFCISKPLILRAFLIDSAVEPEAPLRVICNACDMLNGEMNMFSSNPLSSAIVLNRSKAKELSADDILPVFAREIRSLRV